MNDFDLIFVKYCSLCIEKIKYMIKMKQMKLENIKLYYRQFCIGSKDIFQRLRFLALMVIFEMMRGSMKSGSTNI
jgi:hypothetical protein